MKNILKEKIVLFVKMVIIKILMENVFNNKIFLIVINIVDNLQEHVNSVLMDFILKEVLVVLEL